jgi:hypothetical protein
MKVAVIVVEPTSFGFNRPLVLADELLMMLATVVSDEVQLQLGSCVTFCTEPSENTTVAIICNSGCVAGTDMGGTGMGGGGLKTVATMSWVTTAAVTVTVAEPWMPLRVAVMEVLPIAKPVTSPLVPETLLTCATVLSPDVQLTCVVRFAVLPSLKVPVAVSCTVVPFAIEEVVGVTAIEDTVAAVTLTVVDPEIEPCVAVTSVLPIFTPVAKPLGLTVATVVTVATQPTELVRSFVLPSEKVPVAFSCDVVPLGIEGRAGVTLIETNVAAVTLTVAEPLIAPSVATIEVLPKASPVTSPWLLETLLTCAMLLSAEVQST